MNGQKVFELLEKMTEDERKLLEYECISDDGTYCDFMSAGCFEDLLEMGDDDGEDLETLEKALTPDEIADCARASHDIFYDAFVHDTYLDEYQSELISAIRKKIQDKQKKTEEVSKNAE